MARVIQVSYTVDVVLPHRAEGGLIIYRRTPSMRDVVGLLCFVWHQVSDKCCGLRDPLGDDGGVPRQHVCSTCFHSIHGLPSLV